jgi:hypothetical protein
MIEFEEGAVLQLTPTICNGGQRWRINGDNKFISFVRRAVNLQYGAPSTSVTTQVCFRHCGILQKYVYVVQLFLVKLG